MGDKENCADDMLGLPYLAATVATAISAKRVGLISIRWCWQELLRCSNLHTKEGNESYIRCENRIKHKKIKKIKKLNKISLFLCGMFPRWVASLKQLSLLSFFASCIHVDRWDQLV
jgi:hypothetical protein